MKSIVFISKQLSTIFCIRKNGHGMDSRSWEYGNGSHKLSFKRYLSHISSTHTYTHTRIHRQLCIFLNKNGIALYMFSYNLLFLFNNIWNIFTWTKFSMPVWNVLSPPHPTRFWETAFSKEASTLPIPHALLQCDLATPPPGSGA